jgi:cytochrome P450
MTSTIRKYKGKIPPLAPYTFSETVKRSSSGKIHRFILEIARKVGPIFRLPVPGPRLYLGVVEPSLARRILEGKDLHGDYFSDKSFRYRVLTQITKGFPTMVTKRTLREGWDWSRKGVAPSFSTMNLNKRFPELQSKVAIFMNIMGNFANEGKVVEDISSWMLRLTVDFLTASMFDMDFKTMESERIEDSLGLQFLEYVPIVFKEIGLRRIFNPLRKYWFWDKQVVEANNAIEKIFQIGQTVLDNYRATHTAEEIENDASILGRLACSPYPTEQERVADVVTFLLAGHDTTSYQLSWIIVELGRHPEVVAKLRAELKQVLPEGSDPTKWTPQHLSQLSYLYDVIREGQRLWPSAAITTSREALVDIPYDNGTSAMIIPTGSAIGIHAFAMGRLGIDHPDEFIPERWQDKSQAEKLKELFLPFSYGQRSCVGQNLALLELKLVLACLFSRFDFELVSEVDDHFFITLKPVNANFHVKLC